MEPELSFDHEEDYEICDAVLIVHHLCNCSLIPFYRPTQSIDLHAERITNFLTAKNDPTWPEAELQDRILEDDLDLQLSQLKAYMNDPRVEDLEMPGQQRAEKVHSDIELMDHGISVPTTSDVYSATPEAQHTASVSILVSLSRAMALVDRCFPNTQFALMPIFIPCSFYVINAFISTAVARTVCREYTFYF